MKIPYTKAHGAKNDFLLTWSAEAPKQELPEMARAICDRHTGVGADGWILIEPGGGDHDAAIRLFNSDGSEAEISGNGTRCAAALLAKHGMADQTVRIRTGAGIKTMRLLDRSGLRFSFEMNMGRPEISRETLAGRDVTILCVGNPQCALPVQDFDFDWRAVGAEIERHQQFPRRINVSFFKKVDDHSIEVRFWERGAGETMSSGTGATGAAAAAMARGMVKSPVRVLTPAGPLEVYTHDLSTDVYLVGPAEIIAEGLFFLRE